MGAVEKILDRAFLRDLRNMVATVKALLFIAGGLLVAGSAMYVVVADFNPSPFVWGVAAGLGVACIWTVALWYWIARVHNPPFYKILEVHGSLLVQSCGDHYLYTYEKRQKIRVLRKSLRLVEFRSHWTGRSSKPMEVRPLVGGHVVLDGVTPEEDGRVHRWVYPGGPVGRGQELEIGVKQVHEDDQVRQKPYYRDGGGLYKAQKLTVVTTFLLGEEPESVKGAVWNTRVPLGQDNLVDTLDYEREIDRKTGIVSFTVAVKRPKRYHSYGVRWHWPDSS